jgi:hypothetical protein
VSKAARALASARARGRSGRPEGGPYGAAVCELSRSDEPSEPTPGERLIYALGQLFRQWHDRATLTPPQEVDVEGVAKMLGIWGEVEFAQDGDDEDEPVWYLHLPAEVLVIDPREDFPWRLLGDFEWAEEQQRKEFWRYFH